jgi:hypothetical protein
MLSCAATPAKMLESPQLDLTALPAPTELVITLETKPQQDGQQNISSEFPNREDEKGNGKLGRSQFPKTFA